jgi:hypothetical protein
VHNYCSTLWGKKSQPQRSAGARLVVVDALDDEAQRFYEHFHFAPVKNRERPLHSDADGLRLTAGEHEAAGLRARRWHPRKVGHFLARTQFIVDLHKGLLVTQVQRLGQLRGA